MAATTEDDLETMPEEELLAMPQFNAAPGNLTRLWARHSAILHQHELDELALELSGGTSRHLMIFPDQDPRAKQKREEEHERAWREEQEREDYQRRAERLLAQIEERQCGFLSSFLGVCRRENNFAKRCFH